MHSMANKNTLDERRNVKRLKIQNKYDVRATFFSYDHSMTDCHIFEGRIFDLSQSGVAFQITSDILGSKNPLDITLRQAQRVVFLLDLPQSVSWDTWQTERFDNRFASNRIVLGGEVVRDFTANDGILRYAARFDDIVDGELVRSMIERALQGMISADQELAIAKVSEDTEPTMIVFLSKMD